jgi:hypothetical protein
VNNDTPIAHLTEEIIGAIQKHIKPDGANGDVVAHKDRAYQKVFGVLVARSLKGEIEVRS